MIEDILFLYWFIHWPKRWGFYFLFEKVIRFHISNGVWDIIPGICTYAVNSFLRVPTVVLVAGDHLFYEFRILRAEFSS